MTQAEEERGGEEARDDGMRRLLEVMARLRRDCPWDRAQTFATIAPYTIEESYEVADAIAREDLEALRDELGDLLFQVVFHAHLASELGAFDFEEVAHGVSDKMIRRHPHVYGPAAGEEEGTAAAPPDWERGKMRERGPDASALDGIPANLPPLARAAKLQRRAAGVGFDWPAVDGVFTKLEEEIGELRAALDAGEGQARVEAELGDVLFTCVNLARRLALNSDQALTRTNLRFEERFREMERAAGGHEQLAECSPEELETLWEAAKQRGDSER